MMREEDKDRLQELIDGFASTMGYSQVYARWIVEKGSLVGYCRVLSPPHDENHETQEKTT